MKTKIYIYLGVFLVFAMVASAANLNVKCSPKTVSVGGTVDCTLELDAAPTSISEYSFVINPGTFFTISSVGGYPTGYTGDYNSATSKVGVITGDKTTATKLATIKLIAKSAGILSIKDFLMSDYDFNKISITSYPSDPISISSSKTCTASDWNEPICPSVCGTNASKIAYTKKSSSSTCTGTAPIKDCEATSACPPVTTGNACTDSTDCDNLNKKCVNTKCVECNVANAGDLPTNKKFICQNTLWKPCNQNMLASEDYDGKMITAGGKNYICDKDTGWSLYQPLSKEEKINGILKTIETELKTLKDDASPLQVISAVAKGLKTFFTSFK